MSTHAFLVSKVFNGYLELLLKSHEITSQVEPLWTLGALYLYNTFEGTARIIAQYLLEEVVDTRARD